MINIISINGVQVSFLRLSLGKPVYYIFIIIIITITSIDDIGTDDRHSLLTLKSELK